MKVNRMALTIIGRNAEPRPLTQDEQAAMLAPLRGLVIPWLASSRPKLPGVELFSWKADVRAATVADLFSFVHRPMGQLDQYLAEAYAAATDDERQKLESHTLFEIREKSNCSTGHQLKWCLIRFLQMKWFSKLSGLDGPRESVSIRHMANLNHIAVKEVEEGGYTVRNWAIPMPTNLANRQTYDALDQVIHLDPDLVACPMVSRFALCQSGEKMGKEVWVPIVRTVKQRNGLLVHRDIAIA